MADSTVCVTDKRGKQIKIDQVNNIVIMCWGLLGDVFIRVSLVEAVQQRFPAARIVTLVDPIGAHVFNHHPNVAQCFVFERSKKSRARYLKTFFKNIVQLRRQHFDICINPYSGGSSALITRLLGAKIRIGFDHKANLRRANNVLVPHPEFCEHWIKGFATLLGPLGISVRQVRIGTSFHVTDQAREFAREYLSTADAKYVGFNLGAGEISKCWPVENYVELARHLHQRFGLVPLVVTNPGMEHLAQEFVSRYGKDACVNPSVLPLDRLAALLLRCTAFVTGDTSIMHLAFGLRIPSLLIFTKTWPAWHVVEDSPHVICFKPHATEKNRCGFPLGTADISVAEAEEKFTELFQQYCQG